MKEREMNVDGMGWDWIGVEDDELASKRGWGGRFSIYLGSKCQLVICLEAEAEPKFFLNDQWMVGAP